MCRTIQGSITYIEQNRAELYILNKTGLNWHNKVFPWMQKDNEQFVNYQRFKSLGFRFSSSAGFRLVFPWMQKSSETMSSSSSIRGLRV